jgi:hypothetical protein
MTDIDHIISKEALEDVHCFKGDKMTFARHLAILDENGILRNDLDTLLQWDIDPIRYKIKGLYAGTHGNTWAMKKELFDTLGGYNHSYCHYGFHAPRRMGEDCYFNRVYGRYAAEHKLTTTTGRPIHIFPIGRYNKKGDNNPKGLFHKLSYEPVTQPMLE